VLLAHCIALGGKTGTVQMADGSRGYGARRYQSSFAGYFSAEDPKYSIIVVIRNPRNGYYGHRLQVLYLKSLQTWYMQTIWRWREKRRLKQKGRKNAIDFAG
jgi:cell division protein FtsI/penicillin-binding protein 2